MKNEKMERVIKSIVTALTVFLLISCSSDDGADGEESVVDQAVQKTADKAVRYIQEPIDKAQAVKVSEEERMRKLDEQVQ